MANAPHKGANMNPGEYIGKDGRTYRWKHERLSDNSAEGYDHQAHVHEWETEWIDPADWLDAKAALDALIEAESGEWVYLMARETQTRYRIHPDGSQPQWYDDEQWTEDIDDVDWAEHYRKGREVALEEANHRRCEDCWYWPAIESHSATVTKMQARYNALAEAARELVEAVLRAVDNARVDPQTQRDIRNAAKKVEAKL